MILKWRFTVSVASQPALPWQPFCAPLVVGSSSCWTWYDLPVLSYYNFYLDTLRYVVTLSLDLLTLESCHVMPLGWSIRVPSLNMIRLTVSELGRLQFSIDRQLKVPIFTFLGVKGSNFKFNLSNPQKALPWRERRIMTYWALGCVQKCDLWAWLRKEKKDRNIHASNWLFAQTTHVDVGPWNFACGVVSGKSSYISSFMKIGPGVSELWGAGVENRPLPLTRPVDYTTACM